MRRASVFAAAALLSRGAATAAPPYAIWAHSHFVWLSGGANQSAVTHFLADWEAHNISVGAVNIDSSWSTGYNTFEVDTRQWPQFESFVAGVHGNGQRVILWMTSMVDVDSPNYASAFSSGFLVRDGFGDQANLSWWHGTGGLLDYTTPAAVLWWQAQMDNVLRLGGGAGGVDGFKCDGTDPYIIELITPKGASGNNITYREYADWYYGHTFNYSRSINPEALIWSRPVDSFPLFLNLSAFLEYSPKYVMWSGWVGDQDPTFPGLRDALVNVYESAWQNYTNFASDTGGYRGGVRTPELLLRWSQVNAFLPLFENGGNDDHTPWAYEAPGSTELTDAYRRLVAAHYELGPYLWATGGAAYAAGVSAIHPTSAPPADFPFIIEPDDVADWSFALGPAMYVAPVVFANVSLLNVTLPGTSVSAALAQRWGGPPSPAAAAGWADYWSAATYPPGARIEYAVPLPRTGAPTLPNAVFMQQATLLPLHVSTPLGAVPQGHEAWAPALTLLLIGLDVGDTASVPIADGAGPLNLTARATRHAARALRFECAPFDRPLVLVWRHAVAATPGARALPPQQQQQQQPATATLHSRAGLGGGAPLRLRDPEPPRVGETPLALAYDATSRDGGRYPVASLSPRLWARFEGELAGSFSASDAEVVVYLGAAHVAGGAVVEIAF